MKADNISAFNCRYRKGVCCTWSTHAFGKDRHQPGGEPVRRFLGGLTAERREVCEPVTPSQGIIFRKDRVWWAFHAIGWEWGGTRTGSEDYQLSSNGK